MPEAASEKWRETEARRSSKVLWVHFIALHMAYGRYHPPTPTPTLQKSNIVLLETVGKNPVNVWPELTREGKYGCGLTERK